MKKLFLILVIAGIAATGAVAQEQKEVKVKQEKVDVKVDKTDWDKKLKDELRLTDEQTVKYDALNKEYKEKFDAVLNDASLDKAVQKEKKMTLKKEKEAKLFEFLTADQQAAYKDVMEKKKKEMSAKPGA